MTYNSTITTTTTKTTTKMTTTDDNDKRRRLCISYNSMPIDVSIFNILVSSKMCMFAVVAFWRTKNQTFPRTLKPFGNNDENNLEENEEKC